jgi:hypothetical protein
LLKENSEILNWHTFQIDLKSDNFLPRDAKTARPPGIIQMSLRALVLGGRWTFVSCLENMLICQNYEWRYIR